jgi:predicted RNA-binding Zn-ribbon protein involved in translation (DUF1610 family)
VSLANKTQKGMSLANKLTSQRITRKVIKMNKIQIVDIRFDCETCGVSITKMCHSERLHEVSFLCYDCYYATLTNKRKVSK